MRGRGSVWLWPLVLAALTAFGLLSALLGEHGLWLVLSWLSLAAPLAVIARCVLLRRRVPAAERRPG